MIHSTINSQNYQSDARAKKVLAGRHLEYFKAQEFIDLEDEVRG